MSFCEATRRFIKNADEKGVSDTNHGPDNGSSQVLCAASLIDESPVKLSARVEPGTRVSPQQVLRQLRASPAPGLPRGEEQRQLEHVGTTELGEGRKGDGGVRDRNCGILPTAAGTVVV